MEEEVKSDAKAASLVAVKGKQYMLNMKTPNINTSKILSFTTF